MVFDSIDNVSDNLRNPFFVDLIFEFHHEAVSSVICEYLAALHVEDEFNTTRGFVDVLPPWALASAGAELDFVKECWKDGD